MAAGLGWIGSIISPWIMYYFRGTQPFFLFATFSLVGCITMMFLPFDTSGRELDSLNGE